MSDSIANKIAQVKAARKAIFIDLKKAEILDKNGRKLPKLTQYIAKQAIASVLPTDDQIDQLPVMEYLDKQLQAMSKLQDVCGNFHITEDEIANRLLFAGADYKGQAQSGYSVLGGGLKADVSIDPAAILGCGFVSTKLDASMGAKRAEQLLIIVQAHPTEISNRLKTDQPITLHTMYGTLWEGTSKASLFVDVGAQASLGLGFDKANDIASSSASTTSFDVSNSESSSTVLSMECVSFGVTAKAGFQSTIEYTYQNICLFDDTPTYYPEGITAVRKGLKPLFKFSEAEDVVKAKVIEFQNRHRQYFTNKIKKEKILGFSRWTSTVAKWLRQGLTHPEIPPEIERAARSYLTLLKPFYDSVPHDADSFLALSSHSPSAGAGLAAEAKITAKVLDGNVAAGEAKTRVDALKIAGSYKQANFRYQSKTPLGNDLQPVLYTQDTAITYGQVDLTPIAIASHASSRVLGREVANFQLRETLKKRKINNPEIKHTLYNSIKYNSVCVYWQKPSASSTQRQDDHSINSLQGSGLGFGSSVSLVNLLHLSHFDSYADQWQYQETATLATNLAKRLHVSIEHIKKLIVELDRQFDGLSGYLKELQIVQGLDAILIESSFDIADQKINCVFKDGKFAIDKKATEASMQAFLSGQSQKPREPQSIRLRYRLADKANSDSTPFKLGFKIFDTGIGIQLTSVDRAGAEGIVDLATVWFDDQLSILSTTNPEAVYESAVPPVALFCQ